MASWIKEVPVEALEDGKAYFLAKKWESGCAGISYLFLCRLLSGKQQWGSKPGIAIRCSDTAQLRKTISEHQDFVAVEIPADADKRWKARKRRFI